MLISVSWSEGSATRFEPFEAYAKHKTKCAKRKIPDSFAPTSSRTNQSSLTCVCGRGRLSSRIRFSNCGLVLETVILVLATAVWALLSAGNWIRSGAATNTNEQPGVIPEMKYKILRQLHLQWNGTVDKCQRVTMLCKSNRNGHMYGIAGLNEFGYTWFLSGQIQKNKPIILHLSHCWT